MSAEWTSEPLLWHYPPLLSLMRGADTFTESLFAMCRLEVFLPAHHPLRPIRRIANAALAKMEGLLTRMYEAAIKGRRSSIAPEKRLRAMLLQMLDSVRSDQQLMGQVQYNIRFRWFLGLSMDDMVWVPTVFSKNREHSRSTMDKNGAKL